MSGPALGAALEAAWGGPPPAVAAQGRLLLLDSLGCALAGLMQERPRAMAAALAATMPGGLRLAGLRQAGGPGLGPAGAAAVLATAMCWDEANDGLARAHGRPGLAVAPLALAAIAGGLPVAEAVRAFSLGYEIGGRAGEAWRLRPGMHVDGSWHSLGAAVAAVRLAGGDVAAAGRALRLAACQIPFALYAPIAAGMDGRNSYPAHAVLLGQLCAAAAMAGMDAPESGFATARALALGLETPAEIAPPGEWLLAEAYIKPFAGVRHAHYAAAAALRLRPAQPVVAVALHTYAEALRYAGNRAPEAAIAAQFSLSWAVAAALVQGDLGPAAYTAAALADPRMRRIEALVTLHEDPALPGRAARLVVTLADGQVLEARCDSVPGDAAHPMGEAAVRAKFAAYAGAALGPAGVARVVAGLLDPGAPGPGAEMFGGNLAGPC
ncbi:2-methylcitrate dehydratase PrpD [Humitalea rosea]|uniref:2-methylcitrate dehydratase PrpD n=1 Tax=Humitalea rosea TaxID=990373 RepID=A0A2W7I240_9PROT|nr:MmgE/PrpD family protein [Humitalea rosea]PZW40814.1 2-methylcitrate dehydratase PrpD [Humitalea rosea]